MKAEYRVKNEQGKNVGFIVDGKFMTCEECKKNINSIENLNWTLSGKLISKHGSLPVKVRKASSSTGAARMNLATAHSLIANGLPIAVQRIVSKRVFQRDVQLQFDNWYTSNRQYANNLVLYVEGARQTGKTTELLYFACKHYNYIVYFNLLSNKDVLSVFETEILSKGMTVPAFSQFCRTYLHVNYSDTSNTLFVIDEIQCSSRVYNALRWFRYNLQCDVAVTGSYLGRTLTDEYFQPMGDIYRVQVLPLSFKEFASALGHSEYLSQMKLDGTTPDIHNVLRDDYLIYRRVGGYPAVVMEYYNTRKTSACNRVLQGLISTFTQESSSYFTTAKQRVIFENTFDAAARIQLQEKRGAKLNFQFIADFIRKDQKEFVSRAEVDEAVSWLCASGILGMSELYMTNQYYPNRRCYFTDTGMLSIILQRLGVSWSDAEGLLTETFAYCELARLYDESLSNAKGVKRIPAFGLCNEYELDFVMLAMDDRHIGIEVKTTSGTTKSLDTFLSRGLISKGIVAKDTPGGEVQGKKQSIPIYMVGLGFPYD